MTPEAAAPPSTLATAEASTLSGTIPSPTPPDGTTIPLSKPQLTTEEALRMYKTAEQKKKKEDEPPSEGDILQAVQIAWDGQGGAVSLLTQAQSAEEYDLSDEALEKFAQDHDNAALDSDLVNEEKARREEVNQALDIINKAKNGKLVEESSGVFEVIGSDGQPTGERVRVQQAVKPVIDELRRMTKEEKPPEDGKPPEPTDRANHSMTLLGILEPRLVKYDTKNGPEYFIDPTRDLEMKRTKETVNLGWDVLEALIGADAASVIKNGKIDKKLLESLEAQGTVGHLASLLTTYEKQGPETLQDNKTILGTLLNQAFRELLEQPPKTLTEKPELFSRFRKVLADNETFFTNQMGELKVQVLRLAGYSMEKILADRLFQRLPADKILDIMKFSLLCETQVKDGKLSNEANQAIWTYVTKGHMDDAEHTVANVINSFAEESRASTFFTSLGFDVEGMKNPNNVKAHAQELAKTTIDLINKRRTQRGESQLEGIDFDSHMAVIEHHIIEGLAKIDSKNPLTNWLKMLGMLALIMGPSASQLLNIGVEEDRGGPQQQ